MIYTRTWCSKPSKINVVPSQHRSFYSFVSSPWHNHLPFSRWVLARSALENIGDGKMWLTWEHSRKKKKEVKRFLWNHPPPSTLWKRIPAQKQDPHSNIPRLARLRFQTFQDLLVPAEALLGNGQQLTPHVPWKRWDGCDWLRGNFKQWISMAIPGS